MNLSLDTPSTNITTNKTVDPRWSRALTDRDEPERPLARSEQVQKRQDCIRIESLLPPTEAAYSCSQRPLGLRSSRHLAICSVAALAAAKRLCVSGS
jgi:hypothetical protein